MLHVVIMAGGSGTRFWPKSRRNTPKQLARLFGARSMLRQTVDRTRELAPPERTWIVTGIDQAAATRAEVPELPEANLIVEPNPRDTAACVGLAATIIDRTEPGATMLVLPADHVVKPAAEFQRTAEAAAAVVEREPKAFVTLGVRPTRAETGYGYIERGAACGTSAGFDVYMVSSFTEKPDRARAEEYLKAGTYAWNSGVFLWKSNVVLEVLRENRPALGEALQRIAASLGNAHAWEVTQAEYARIPREPIDKAVMEPYARVSGVRMLDVSYQWSDVGDWRSLAELLPGDAHANVSEGPVHMLDSKRSVVIAGDGHLIATLGIEDLVVVQSGGATLIARKDALDNLKQLVEGLNAAGFKEYQ